MSDYYDSDPYPDDDEDEEQDPDRPAVEVVTGEPIRVETAEIVTAAVPALKTVPGTDMSLIPMQDELRGIAQMAVTLCEASNLPQALQNKPADVFMVLLTARDLGVSLTTAIREFHVIDGKVTTSPKVRMAMVRQQGIGKLWPDPENDREEATWYGERHDQPGTVYRITYTMVMANGVKIGKDKQSGRPRYLSDKDNWQNFPERMLSWRALGYLLDDAFPEVGTGIYSPDEMGAVTDENGEPVIDLGNTDPLTPTRRQQARRGREARGSAETPANPADIERISKRLDIIKRHPDAQEAMKVLWLAVDENGRRKLSNLSDLLHREVRRAEAIVSSIEKRGEKGEWGEWPPLDPERPFEDAEPVTKPVSPDPVVEELSPIDAVAGGITNAPSVTGLAAEPEPAVEAEPTHAERVIQWAKDLPTERLNDELRMVNLPLKGNNQTKRHRLAEFYITTTAQAGGEPGERADVS